MVRMDEQKPTRDYHLQYKVIESHDVRSERTLLSFTTEWRMATFSGIPSILEVRSNVLKRELDRLVRSIESSIDYKIDSI